MLCTIALLKHVQILSDISFKIYFRKALNNEHGHVYVKKILGKLKRQNDIKIVTIVAKCKFDTEPYDSFVEEGAFLNVQPNLTNKKEFL